MPGNARLALADNANEVADGKFGIRTERKEAQPAWFRGGPEA
jgi:hypothetical protein